MLVDWSNALDEKENLDDEAYLLDLAGRLSNEVPPESYDTNRLRRVVARIRELERRDADMFHQTHPESMGR